MEKQRHPNIVFFFSDQQRHDTLGAYDENAKRLNITPNLDILAKFGTKFEYAFTPQPVCGPARACLQTGRFATQSGCFTNGRALKEGELTLAKYLGRVGYDTSYIGKWHLASNNMLKKDDENYSDYATAPIPPQLRGGYRYWRAADILEFTSHGYGGYVYDQNQNKREFENYRCDAITDFAIEYIENKSELARDEEKPFFMFLSHIEPHHQNDRERFEGPDGSLEKFGDVCLPEDLKEAHKTEPDFLAHYANYLGCCNSLDHNLGRVVAALKDKNIFEQTVIIYTSDHSCHFRTRNSEYKRSCHENSIRVPLLISGGQFCGGQKIDRLVSLIDLPPTILELAGVDIPADFMGKSLVNALDGKSEWEEEIYTQISESKLARCIRTQDWKYSIASDENPWTTAETDTYFEDFLYDLKSDPHEQNNLIGSTDEKTKAEKEKLAQILIRHMNRAGEKTPVIENIEKKRG